MVLIEKEKREGVGEEVQEVCKRETEEVREKERETEAGRERDDDRLSFHSLAALQTNKQTGSAEAVNNSINPGGPTSLHSQLHSLHLSKAS